MELAPPHLGGGQHAAQRALRAGAGHEAKPPHILRMMGARGFRLRARTFLFTMRRSVPAILLTMRRRLRGALRRVFRRS